jgi:hypothetical protein
MKWCCTAFENHYRIAGERGIAIVVGAGDQHGPLFLVQARAFDRDRTPEFKVTEPMSLVTETVVDFCPWCGVRLHKWYRKHLPELIMPDLIIARE